MNPPTDWVSAIAILAAGLVLGALFFYFNKRRNAPTLGGEVDLERKDLEAKRDALVQQLRDSSLSADERARLELETANALRKLDAHVSPRSSEELRGTPRNASAVNPSAMNPTVKGFLWGAASTAALFALGYFVMQQAKPRQEGDEITGGFNQQQQASAQTQSGAPDPMVQQLEAAVRAQPNNIELRNNLAQAYLERDNLMAVFEQTRAVLAQAPDNSRALTLQGLVRMAMGETEQATSMLQQATKSDPRNLDGWVALAWVYAQSNRMQDAERMIASAAQQVPEERTRLEQVFVQMKTQLAQRDMQQAGNPLPEGHPEIKDPPVASAAAPAASGGAGVRVTLDLDAAATQRTGIVFVIARNPAGGPPVAVKRVVATSFPLNVELTAADSMMGQALPATFRVEARLDADGDPMTKPPTDPSAMQNGVAPGATVRLALK
ncbi:MAG TPA: tetratricopeptide repeat protein [Thermoanaerobaculia bacterium]|nr:tetratricopeptide repeat protein [Thermoanaerobaculia bacterium]